MFGRLMVICVAKFRNKSSKKFWLALQQFCTTLHLRSLIHNNYPDDRDTDSTAYSDTSTEEIVSQIVCRKLQVLTDSNTTIP
jgi:hypothetical protein